MVEIQTTRTSRVEDNDYIAVRREEYLNGVGKKVVVITEEHNITPEIIDDITDNLADAELKTATEELEKLKSEHSEIEAEIKDTIESEEYKAFKENLKTEQMQKFFATLNREKALAGSSNQIKIAEMKIEDIKSWKQQFIELRGKIMPPTKEPSI